MAPSPGSDLHKSYFDDPTLSDLTIRIVDRTVHVHRIVLCRRSIYFEKLILGEFKVRDSLATSLQSFDLQSR
jgi:hypothetical protein